MAHTMVASDKRVIFTWDDDEAKGEILLEPAGWGLNIKVNDIQVGFIDLFPPAQEEDDGVAGLPQLIIDNADEDEPMAKLLISHDERTLVVHRDLFHDQKAAVQGIHSDWDHVFNSGE